MWREQIVTEHETGKRLTIHTNNHIVPSLLGVRVAFLLAFHT